MVATIKEFKVKTASGKEIDFAAQNAKAFLVVNTASKCGFAPQFKGLEKLYREYKDKGLFVIGFPSDQFMGQEPLENAELEEACEVNFGVTFPLAEKSDVNGSETNPVFEFLKHKAPGVIGESIKWNFTKFLVSADGESVKRFAPSTEPERLVPEIERVLGR